MNDGQTSLHLIMDAKLGVSLLNVRFRCTGFLLPTATPDIAPQNRVLTVAHVGRRASSGKVQLALSCTSQWMVYTNRIPLAHSRKLSELKKQSFEVCLHPNHQFELTWGER